MWKSITLASLIILTSLAAMSSKVWGQTNGPGLDSTEYKPMVQDSMQDMLPVTQPERPTVLEPEAFSERDSVSPAWQAAADPREVIALATDISPARRPFGRFGLALKSGEASGALGIQIAWNLSRHLQVCAGTGGVTNADYYLTGERGRMDSRYLLARVFWIHAFLATGYSLKISKVESSSPERVLMATKSEQGIPIHFGYEFGHRSGFYFSTSVGYLFVIGGGNRDVTAGSAIGPGKYRTAKSGPGAGMTIGYYLW